VVENTVGRDPVESGIAKGERLGIADHHPRWDPCGLKVRAREFGVTRRQIAAGDAGPARP